MTFPISTAERVLDELQIASPDDLLLLEQIAWERGALVRYKDLESAEARLVVVNKPAVITISTHIHDERRHRFSIAHELGHLEMHRQQSVLNTCTKEKLNDWGTRILGKEKKQNPEQEANLFASALLLPERFFSPLCKEEEPSLDYISSLADKFNVSLTSTALRYLFFSPEPVSIVYSEGNHIRWFQESDAFREIREELRFFIDVRSKLDASTRASFFFRDGSIPPGTKSIQASAWFTPGDYINTATIKEHSIAMPVYNATLTLLWIDDVIEDDH